MSALEQVVNRWINLCSGKNSNLQDRLWGDDAAAELEELKDEVVARRAAFELMTERLIAEESKNRQLRAENALLNKQNRQLTDALYKEALRSVDAFALIQRVLYAKGTDTLDRLDIKPFLEWVEAFPKPPTICEHGNKPDKCAHCHPRWD